MITYLWVRHKRESKKEVALADELIEDENDIIVTRINYQEYYQYDSCIQTVRRSAYLYPSRQLTHNVFPDEVRPKTDKLSPKKRMKAHKIDQGIRKETFVSPRLSYGKCKRGPLNPPIIFKSITETMDYIKNYKPKQRR